MSTVGGTVRKGKMRRFREYGRKCSRLHTTFKIAEDLDEIGATYLKIRDIFIYIHFMSVLLTITLGVYNWNSFHLINAVRSSLIERYYYCGDERTNVNNVSSPEDFWCYFRKGFIPMYKRHPFWGARGTQNETLLLTKPRMRQVRVQVEECPVPLPGIICSSEFREDNEETKSYNIGNGTAWTYNPPDIMGDVWYKGRVSYYNSAGYYFLFESQEILDFYKDNYWIDERTRAVFLDFTFYNLNINMFCVCQVLFEWPATGGVIPSWKCGAVKLIRYNDQLDYKVLACEIMLVVFCFYYTQDIILEMKHFKLRFFKMWDNWVDMMIVVLSWTSIFMLINRLFATNNFIVNYVERDYLEFVDYQPIKKLQQRCDRMLAITLFYGFLRIYRYLHFDTIDQLFITLKFCFKDVASFCFLFFVVLFSYAQLGALLFQNYLRNYMTIQEASFTLLQVMMGEFNYQKVTNVSNILGPLYVVSFVILVVFLLLNMFFAIINATYAVVSSNVQISRKTEYLPFLKHCFSLTDHKIPLFKTKKKSANTNDDRIRQMLIDSGYTDREIGMFFSRYKINNEQELPDAIFNTIVHDKKVPEEYMADLKARMLVIQSSVDSALSKANYFLQRVNSLLARAAP